MIQPSGIDVRLDRYFLHPNEFVLAPTFEVINVARLPIKRRPGMKIGQLHMFRASSPAEHPYSSPYAGFLPIRD